MALLFECPLVLMNDKRFNIQEQEVQKNNIYLKQNGD